MTLRNTSVGRLPSSSYNLMGVRRAKFESAGVIVLPVPYEGTVTYVGGTRNGPQAIISASKHVELYDDELDCEPYAWGIHTLEEVKADYKDPQEMFQSISEIGRQLSKSIVKDGKLLIMLGGEHSITPAMVSALSSDYNHLSVLQLDAHADLRDEYNGSMYNHACAMRRCLEFCPIVQVGIRSLSLPEKQFIEHKQLDAFFMRDIRMRTTWMDDVIDRLAENVYLTIDLDVLDPSIMPSVGTPEPGGLLFDETLLFLRKLSERRRIVAFDVVELSPQTGNIAPDFLSAKLIYKLIGYVFVKVRRPRPNSVEIEHAGNPERRSATMNKLSYILQLTDSATGFKCAMRIDPESATSIKTLMDRYVKVINEGIMTPESAKNLSTIQDCVFKIDDNGNLTELYEGLIIRQNDDLVNLHDEPTFELVQLEDGSDLMLLDLTIDRSQITEEGNPYGYNIRKWKKNRVVFERFVHECLSSAYGKEADRILELSDHEDRKRFLFAIGKRIWESDFETFSRFIGDKLWFKDPAETLHNIIAGRGGVCTEKCSAMKLITDAYGFRSEYLLGGPGAKGPFPVSPLRKMLETLDFELGKKYMVFWQHMALLYDLDGEDILIDVTNGNVPFLFLTGDEIEELLRQENKKSISVRMVMNDEEFYYHVTPQDIPENLLSAMQDWIEDIDLIHVFDDGLGLLIRKDYYVWPVMYRDEDEKLMEYNWWLQMKEEKNFPAVELLDNFSLPGPVVNEFKEKYPQKFADIISAYDYLVERYNESYRESEDDPEYNMAYMFVKLQ